ncbi:UNVERIFIED_CONTAM: hypothetical protein HDU68_003730 [Siphonaria sp. JEL0065]|nr:hypothetical protein HDU68_003730 [Siphonaria sp. JEL0065]
MTSRVVSVKSKPSQTAGEKAKQVLLKKMEEQQMKENSEALGAAAVKPVSAPLSSTTTASAVNAAGNGVKAVREEKAVILKAKEEKLMKAAELMAKRMSGGSGTVGVSLRRAGSLGPGADKEKLKNDLKLTARLRGPDLILKRRAKSSENQTSKKPLLAPPRTPTKATSTPKKQINSGRHMKKTPTLSSRKRNPTLTLKSRSKSHHPFLNSGKKLSQDFQNVNWDEMFAGENHALVSDSPIKDYVHERPAVT